MLAEFFVFWQYKGMGDDPQAPWFVRWLGAVLRTIPAPTDSWADIIGSLAWPLLVLVLIVRFRRFLGSFLWAIAGRMERGDHVKLGWFEIHPSDSVMVLDPDDVGDSTESFEPADIERIERIFEFIDDAANFEILANWLNQTYGEAFDIEDFLTQPTYASERERAFDQVKGLAG